MTRPLAIAATLTALWFIGGVWYYDCKIKRVCGPESVAVSESDAPAVVTETAPIAISTSPAASAPPAASSAPARVQPVTITAYFGRKSTDIVVPADSEAALPELLRGVANGQRVRVVGHSDARGSPALKAELSAQRAVILHDWLRARGVPEKSFAAIESQEDREPVASNATAEGRAQNRRAVATLLE